MLRVGFEISLLCSPLQSVMHIPSLSLLRNRGERRMSAFECVRRVYRADGLRGFYRGMSASYAGISETVIHFVIYESIKRRLLEARAPQNMDEEEDSSRDATDFVGMMLAAATSKTCATSIAYPHGKSLWLAFGWCWLLCQFFSLNLSLSSSLCRSDPHQVT